MDVRSFASYGGAFQNYAPLLDPTTDEDVRYRNRYACDAANMTHTACRAIVRFTGVNGADPTDPSGFVHDAHWGSSVGVKPTITRSAEGVWTVAWPTTVDDELTAEDPAVGGGDSHTVNIRAVHAQATAVAGVLKHAVGEVTDANTVTIRGFLADGTADDLAGSIITVWIY